MPVPKFLIFIQFPENKRYVLQYFFCSFKYLESCKDGPILFYTRSYYSQKSASARKYLTLFFIKVLILLKNPLLYWQVINYSLKYSYIQLNIANNKKSLIFSDSCDIDIFHFISAAESSKLMNIDIQKLQYLMKKHTDEFKCLYYNDTIIDGKKYKAGTEVVLFHTTQLIKSGIKELEIQYNVTLYEYLNKEYPIEYRKPVKWIDSDALEHYLFELEQINGMSKRKRFFYLVGDIYRNLNDGKAEPGEIILKNGDRLDFKKWKSVKIYINSRQKFFIRNSENGIIIFGGAEIENYIDETDNLLKKINLVGSMMLHKFDKKFEISPDFVPNKDIYKVDNPAKLAEEYIKTNARLIVFNETLTTAQKEALLLIKRYDPFVRMMVLPPINPKNIGDILLQIKMIYNADFRKK